MKTREVHLVARPQGMPKKSDFAVAERDIGDPADGQVLVQNLYMSVDPYMRPRLTDGQPLNEVMFGDAVGRVLKSRAPTLKEGDLVQGMLGFREHYVAPAQGLQKLTPDSAIPLTVYMHTLGMTGFTAYGGLLDIGKYKDGEVVFVSTAAGAVGSVVAQIAKIKGSVVIGSTGSDDKAAWLRDLGVDHVINYKKEKIGDALARIGKRIDVYFDNVGGDHLEAALNNMAVLGRIPVCGGISGYNGDGPPVRNLFATIYNRVTLRGFTGIDYPQLRGAFQQDMTAWVKAGKVQYKETILTGIDNVGAAMVGLMQGDNIGKMLVKLND